VDIGEEREWEPLLRDGPITGKKNYKTKVLNNSLTFGSKWGYDLRERERERERAGREGGERETFQGGMTTSTKGDCGIK